MLIPESEFPEMPFDGRRFFEAVKGWPHDTALKYLIYLWHYWNHTHCNGLNDDDDYLRRLAECDLQDWKRVKGIIFDGENFFKLDGGKWHQSRCKKVYIRELERYKKNLAKTEPARHAALVTKTVSSSVTDEKWIQALKDNDCYRGIDIDRELGKLAAWCSANGKQVTRRRFVNWLNRAEKPIVPIAGKPCPAPSRAEVIEYAKMKGDKSGFCVGWYDKWHARDFKQNGLPVDWKFKFSEDFAKQRV